MTVISVTIPDELVNRFDSFVKERGYYSRSEAFRDAIRTIMTQSDVSKLETNNEAAVVLTAADIRRRDIDVRLVELRNEFEYSVIHGPAAGISSEAALLGELADGIILVLGANSTRRATARKIKDTLEATRSRILGTVLSERTFPIPERIYRRL